MFKLLNNAANRAPCLSYLTMRPTELRICVKVEVNVLSSPSLISLMVSVDVKHHVYLLREKYRV